MEILNFSTNKMLPRLKAHFLPRSIITEAFVFAVHGWGGRRSHGRWRFVQSLGEDDPGTQLDEWRIGGPGTCLLGHSKIWMVFFLDGGIYPMPEHFQDLGVNSRKSFARWLDEWDLPIKGELFKGHVVSRFCGTLFQWSWHFLPERGLGKKPRPIHESQWHAMTIRWHQDLGPHFCLERTFSFHW